MPILRDGEKYACKQCIQGHRVSGCNHTDRPLLHVNKKGRPVSQCPHCRGLRKARQTHAKCECGERRHSRNNSSESASLDESGCNCFMGKKCTCALKKEPQDIDNAKSVSSASPPNDRSSPMRWIPARRSESAMPRLRHSPTMHKGHASQDFGAVYASQRPYQLGRSAHAAQRSVDSLPLAAYTSSQYQAPTQAYDNQFLAPDTALQHVYAASSLGNPFGDQFTSDFSVHLDQSTIDRTLSPHNTKRYSMNDFSILAGMSQQLPDPQLFPATTNDSQEFPFPDLSNQDFNFPGSTLMNEQHPRVGSMTSIDAPFPALSRSSSGTCSESIEMPFAIADPKLAMSQPVITIDPTWNFEPMDGSEKSVYEYTPSSYHGTPSDYTSPFDDPMLPGYGTDSVNNDDLNSCSPDSRLLNGMSDFVFPGPDGSGTLTQEPNSMHMGQFHVLPDRSAQIPATVTESLLESDFKFPNQDLPAIDGFAGSPLRQGWSPYSDNESMD